jgi:hypothetical protein
MTSVANLSSLTGIAFRFQELNRHPNWKDKDNAAEIPQGSYIIAPSGKYSFQVIWLNKNNERVSIPFSINPANSQWCFQKEQAYLYDNLNDTITSIFDHFKGQNG